MATAYWTKSWLTPPRDNFPPKARSLKGYFKPSFESDKCDPPMSLLLGGEYGRIWHREYEQHVKKLQVKTEDQELQRKRILESTKRILLKRQKKIKTDTLSVRLFKTKLPKKRKIRCDIKDDLLKPKKVPVEKPPECVPCTCKIPKPAEPVRCDVCGMMITLVKEHLPCG